MRLIQYTYPTYRRFVPARPFSRAPYTGLDQEIDRLFDSVFRSGADTARAFPVDLYEDNENTYVRAELPGVNREAIQVEVVEDQLNIQAARSPGAGNADDATTVSRSIGLPDGVQTEKISAQYENGILTVTLPKQEPAQPKKITVQVN